VYKNHLEHENNLSDGSPRITVICLNAESTTEYFSSGKSLWGLFVPLLFFPHQFTPDESVAGTQDL
jgi:hypothetical protein